MPKEIQEKLDTPRTYTPWRPIFIVHMYRYAKAGLTDAAICKALAINKNTLLLWKKKRPEVNEALDLARKDSPGDDGFVRYFYEQMEPRLRRLWDHLTENEQLGGEITNVQAIMSGHSKRAQQGLFLHALVSSHFSPTRAMEKVGLYKRRLDDWKRSDPDFAELLAEIEWHRGNFYEEALHKLVEQGDVSATIFANKTFNRSRGYALNSQVDVNVSGRVEHSHSLDLDKLDLDLDTRAKILEAERRYLAQLESERLVSRISPEERQIKQVEDFIIEKGKNA